MAIEKRRACGYRKVGGLYLVCDPGGFACGQFPFALTACPCCGSGFTQGLGFRWTVMKDLLQLADECGNGGACTSCPLSVNNLDRESKDRAGLLWVGRKFYKTAADFRAEAMTLGISKRISQVPRGIEVGKTWIFLAHPEAMKDIDGKPVPGAFMAFRPQRIEIIITQSQADDPVFMSKIEARKLTPVIVPDRDADHRGSVYDDKKPEQRELALSSTPSKEPLADADEIARMGIGETAGSEIS